MAGSLGFNTDLSDSHLCPTLLPSPNFNAEEDCERLRKAMAGLGTKEKELIEVMGHRSSEQRQLIVSKYRSSYGKELLSKLKSEISGHFYDTMEALCYSPAEFDAHELYKAMKGAGTDESAIIEILCSRSNHQLQQIKEAYGRLFSGHNLEKDIASDTSGDFKHLCIALLQASRDECTIVDTQRARKDAEELYKAGELKWGTDESKSYPHLKAVFNEYRCIANNGIEDALRSEMHGSILEAFIALVRCTVNTPLFFAEKLKRSMKGIGTDDRTLIRIIVSRCQVDMGLIKREFHTLTGKSLESWIEGDTSGDYRQLLLALVSG
ncbi:unnamed protein product [Heterobilharzia americana]|nr:unnamed protein product [Heterobilharzia americana]